MHIREVNISGFRSYRESTNIEAFDRGHNVVVGRNGSGKSNFFFAIQFLLSEEFAHLKQEQRLSMLHEGAGSKITTARVEMVFDNSDRRIPSIEGNEVRVVRQVGHKKDQYHIDGKVVPRADVVNLMESAGFSRSNPYYIVKQGKINELATAPDSHRLKLLKEVAGTRVYDERKEESEKILKETTAKSEKIASLLAYINERLQTLKEESEDLDKYQTYDKMKRSIEYTKLDQEMKEARSHLDKLSDQREEYRKNMADGENQLSNLETELVVARNKLKDLEKTFQGLREEKEALCTEKVTRIEKQAELDLQLKDLNEEVANQRNEAESDEVAKAELETEIGEKTDKLEELVPRFHELQKQEATLQSDIRIAEAKLKELEAKQGHKQLFASADERDKFLKEQVKKLEQQIYETQQQMKKVQDSMVEGDAEKEEISAKIQQLRGESEEVRSQMDEGHQKSQQKRKKLEEMVTEQLDAGRKEKHCRNELLSLENDIQHLEVTNRQVIPRNVYNGIQSVNRVLQHFDDNGRHDVRAGYRGTLMELFSTDPIYYRAIEATAGNRLFHHVVDNDTIAMQILKRMNQDHLHGEVNFFPLNRISAPGRKELPAEAEKNARMMLDDDILEFDGRYDVVMRSVFGGTAIARALDNNATMLARQHGLDCVTLEGDQVSRRGAMTGGFVDVRRSKLEAFNTLREKREARQAVSDACSAAAREVADKSREVDRAKHEIATLDQTISQLRDQYREKMEQCRYMSSQLQRMNMAEDPRQQQRVVLENRVREMTAQRDVLKEDIGQQLSSQMSSQQIGQVADLRDELQNKRDTLKQVSKSRVEVEQEKHKLENILHGNLLKRKARIEAKMDLVEQAEARQKKQAVELELASVRKRMAQIERKLIDIEQQFKDNYTEQAAQLQGEIENLEEQAKDHAGQMDEWAKQSDLICTRQSTLVARRDDASRKIRELGSIPSDAFSKYANMSSKALTRKLEECMQQLKKYENVNKKAMDQYLQATQQREDLQKRMDEQTANEKSITDLLGVLDQRKYDAIMLTFKQVSKNFKEVFTKLVPTGYGELVMQTTGGGGHDSQSMDSESADKHLIEKFSGVGIKVSFTGSSETREMQQLSGGQKSLVALALIFSIQKCDPAPFYLFDEIDAALDQQHRVAVADMIHELSSSAQFITTTFRPELLQHAKKYYGVKFRNKVSHIDVVTKEQAYDFVEDDQTHG